MSAWSEITLTLSLQGKKKLTRSLWVKQSEGESNRASRNMLWI